MPPASASFAALGSTAVVAVTEPALLGEAKAVLAAELCSVDLACSRFRPDSELARVNARAGQPTPISELFAEALHIALDAARATDGLVDPTLGAHVRAAGYDRTFALVRERETWRFEVVPSRLQSWREVELADEALTVRVPAGVELDLGATAKAWAADRAAGRIAAATGLGALVALGGDVAVAGAAPPGGWAVALAADHAAPLAGSSPVVAIRSGGLATSGTAVRRWRTDLGEAHHILDPRSGRPAGGVWSHVSVAAGTCAEANVASTAAVILGEAAPAWLGGRGLPGRAVRRDGSVVLVGAWPEDACAA
jgi:thiamine biosynthesis lipoprotein